MKMNNETRIGILVVGVLAILLVLTWKAGDFGVARAGYHVKVLFRNVDGVALNAPVTLNGLEVGRVVSIDLLYGKETMVEVLLWLQETAKLHQGADAFVKNLGLLGEKYIGLTTGNDARPFLKPGETIYGKEPANFDKLLSQGNTIATNLEEISGRINERLKVNAEAIDRIVLNLDQSLAHVTSISSNVDERLRVNKEEIDETFTHFSKASKNLEELSLDLKENPWKLLYRDPRRKARR